MKTLVAYEPEEWFEGLENFYNEEYDSRVVFGSPGEYSFDEHVDEEPEDSEYLEDLAQISDEVMILATEKDDVDTLASIILEEDDETVVESVSEAGIGKHEYDITVSTYKAVKSKARNLFS